MANYRVEKQRQSLIFDLSEQIAKERKLKFKEELKELELKDIERGKKMGLEYPYHTRDYPRIYKRVYEKYFNENATAKDQRELIKRLFLEGYQFYKRRGK